MTLLQKDSIQGSMMRRIFKGNRFLHDLRSDVRRAKFGDQKERVVIGKTRFKKENEANRQKQ